MILAGVLISAWSYGEPIAVDDYFELDRVTELAISADGEHIVFALESSSLREDAMVKRVFIGRPRTKAYLPPIDEIQDGYSLGWMPGSQDLVFLAKREGAAQLFSYSIASKSLKQLTDSPSSVLQYQFAASGESFAFVTEESSDSPSLFEQLYTGDQGILIDPDFTSVYNFVSPIAQTNNVEKEQTLWLVGVDGQPAPVIVAERIHDFFWSSNGQKLSVIYVANADAERVSAAGHTSISVYEVSQGRLYDVGLASTASATSNTEYYSGGQWIPGEDMIAVQRISEERVWWRRAEWTLIDLSENSAIDVDSQEWRSIDFGYFDEFIPARSSNVYIEKTVKAVRDLYLLSSKGIERAGLLEYLSGSNSLFRFTEDFDTAVFVNQDFQRPPQIYYWEQSTGTVQITELSDALIERDLPEVREITWKGADGKDCYGWFFEPISKGDNNKPWPLVTFVHGGPGSPFLQEFAFQFAGFGGGIWPHPLEVYAAQGMAVFVPNYRGSRTFGYDFGKPTRQDGEPVDDVVTGIEHLVEHGIADPDRLGIAGHSHGVWLGSLIMARSRNFLAGSFAEGVANKFVNYAMMPDTLNRQVHDDIFFQGNSLYDEPARGIESSALFAFPGLETAVLFEAGATSLALAMLDHQKAARYAGMPTEFVVYPKVGHNVRVPSLQRESAIRNLDWFRFWLQDYEDPDPGKVAQYERWRKMRADRCASDEVRKPQYCEASH